MPKDNPVKGFGTKELHIQSKDLHGINKPTDDGKKRAAVRHAWEAIEDSRRYGYKEVWEE